MAELADDDLKDLGLSLGARKRLLKAIAAFHQEVLDLPAEYGAVHAKAKTTPVSDAERCQITVMFCDLVGSTALSGRVDLEKLRAMILAA